MPDTTTEERAARKYAEAQQRHVSLLAAFERALRIIDELYQRLEAQMWAPLANKTYDSGLSRDAVNLSRALAQAGAVHARLLENEAARADAQSEADKVKYAVAFLAKKPASIRQEVIKALLAAS